MNDILNNIPFPVHVIDVEDDFRYIYWNGESDKYFGDGLGRTPFDILTEETARIVEQSTLEVFKTGEASVNRERITPVKSGEEIDTIVNKSIIVKDGKRFVLVVRWDITDMLELQRNDKMLGSFIEYLDGYTWIGDVEKRTMRYGNGLDKIGSLRADCDTFEKVVEHIHPEDRQKFATNFRTFIEGKDGVIIENFRISNRNDGKYEWWESRAILKTTVLNGKPRKVIYGLNLNIQQHKDVEAKLSESVAKAQDADRLKSAFLANMSHEIRTPLNAIVGFSDLLMTEENDEDRENYCNIISTNTELLLRLIGDILDLSKIESNSLDWNYKRVDFAKMFDELYSIMRIRKTNENVSFVCENPYKKLDVVIDKSRVSQVINNYLTNAIKYTPAGKVVMSYSLECDGIRISVSDTGIGIPDDKKSMVFKRFQKLDEFAAGNGLGLSICKALVEHAGGKVGFESEEGKGSTFWAWIPVDVLVKEDI